MNAGTWGEEHLCAVAHACFSFMLYALSGKPRCESEEDDVMKLQGLHSAFILQ